MIALLILMQLLSVLVHLSLRLIPLRNGMIDAVQLAPGLQDLLRQLQAGGNVDVNQPIDSKKPSGSPFPTNDLPLNLVYIALIPLYAIKREQMQVTPQTG
jgi:hypothetical protein